ncbi:hypothetical protein [Alkalibacillus haloalkaliphilus]|uniref:Uncharacterized protein n=1 Tax=Alkalibacillus haloalkaliphilus TaxID=94136 RepID=A0A511W810_9BACI|nr:hypothetical protein [Alkalibacillus haloalkaliphilus]GEN45522.1 hypothetical protein AHA02nite_12980 [Alkalibacillus haloalkaliphilus]
MDLLTRFVTALLSAVVFSIIFSFSLFSLNEFWPSLFVLMMYSTLLFITVGIGFSYLGDYILNKLPLKQQWLYYIMGIIIYAGGGVLTNIYFLTSTFTYGYSDDTEALLYLGIFAALLFYHLKYVVHFSFQRLDV